MRYLASGLAICTGLVVAYAGLVVAGLRCLDACFGDPGSWTVDGGAWQWDATRILAGAVPVLACALLGAVIARHTRLAVAVLGIQAAVTCVLVGLVAAGDTFIDSAFPAIAPLAFVPVLLGVAALLHLRRDAVREGTSPEPSGCSTS